MPISKPKSTAASVHDPMRFAYLAALLPLGAAFGVRVLAHAFQVVAATDRLPPVAAWQGSGLPYPLLLLSQLTILAVMGWSLVRVARGQPVFPAGRAGWALALGALYFAAMAFRLLAGLTVLADVPWFAAPLPTSFHLVLALFLMLLALRDRGASDIRRTALSFRGIARWLAYPATMALGFALYAALDGLGPRLAAFLAVAAGVAAILLLETWLPHRESWRPSAREVAADSAFLVAVQILLPNALALLAAAALADMPRLFGATRALWPHDWPLAAQVVLMILGSDFLRYWLHRAMHAVPWLWRLHAVHHAPARLYSLNVARFHPADKALQFVLDALPFILLGVGGEVLALYFVFYAINGFFQHSNCDVRLGVLNYLISGPELHRWHHSRRIHESNTNLGNNLIVWDLLFGTRFLPAEREVDALGVAPAEAAQAKGEKQ